MPLPTILRFVPIYKPRVWGGGRLRKMLLRQGLPAGPIGESWEIADREEDGVAVARESLLAGTPLGAIAREMPEAVYGRDAGRFARGHFPLLVKWIDAERDLSLQVHPPADVAAELGGEPKTECWAVLHAEPGSRMFVGLREGGTAADLAEALDRGPIEPLLRRIDVGTGDVLFVPSGTVHAIGGGILLAEVQQNSDTTYRLHDWGRLGMDGKPRTLHRKEGLRSIREVRGAGLVRARAWGTLEGERTLIDAEPFRLRIVRTAIPFRLEGDGGFLCVGLLLGDAYLDRELFRKGDWGLVPAETGGIDVTPRGGRTVLLVAEPGRPT